MQDPDIGWHLRNAAHLLHKHAFIRVDEYSFTLAGTPWIDPEWLAEVLLYAGWHVGSTLGLYGVMLGVLEAIFIAFYFLVLQSSQSATRAFAAASTGILFATVSFGPRTLLLGWLCLVVELLLLQEFFQRHRAGDSTPGSPTHMPGLLLLPVLFVLWINLHGSWLIGVAVLLIAVASAAIDIKSGLLQNYPLPLHARRQLLYAVLLSIAVLFLNPYGWHLVAYPFDLAFRQNLNIANIAEWQPTPLSSSRGRVLLGLCAAALLRQLLRPRSWTLYELGLGALGLYAGLHYMRFLFLTALLTLPVLLRDLDLPRPTHATPQRTRLELWLAFLSRDLGGSTGRPWLRGVAIATFACMVFRMTQAAGHTLTETPDFPSPHAAAYLQHFRPEGRVFNDFLWGGYLESNAPQIPVFIDSRVDIFEHTGVFADYLNATRLHDSLRILCKYRIRYVLFEKDTPLVYLLVHSPGWETLYQDEKTILLQRSAGDSAAFSTCEQNAASRIAWQNASAVRQ